MPPASTLAGGIFLCRARAFHESARHATKLWKNPNALTQRARRRAHFFSRVEAAILLTSRARADAKKAAEVCPPACTWAPIDRPRAHQKLWRLIAGRALARDGAGVLRQRSTVSSQAFFGTWRACLGAGWRAVSHARWCFFARPVAQFFCASGGPIGAAGRAEIRRGKVAVKNFIQTNQRIAILPVVQRRRLRRFIAARRACSPRHENTCVPSLRKALQRWSDGSAQALRQCGFFGRARRRTSAQTHRFLD